MTDLNLRNTGHMLDAVDKAERNVEEARDILKELIEPNRLRRLVAAIGEDTKAHDSVGQLRSAGAAAIELMEEAMSKAASVGAQIAHAEYLARRDRYAERTFSGHVVL